MQIAKILLLAALLPVSGCRVDSNKKSDGDDVKVTTPFGKMQVKTNGAASEAGPGQPAGSGLPAGLGLPAYPGAQMVQKERNNSGSADVDLSFGDFQLKVKAANFRTSDPLEKVEAFYRDGLKKYGDVIVCQGDHPVGTLTRTPEGLTCDPDNDRHVTLFKLTGEKRELKAGSKLHQHVVTLENEGSGTKFELVAVDLPGMMAGDGGRDSGQ